MHNDALLGCCMIVPEPAINTLGSHMLRIDKFKVHFKHILRLNALNVRLIIREKKLSFEIDTRPKKTVIEHRFEIESRNRTVEYAYDDFQALIRLAKKLKYDSFVLLDDLRLCCSAGSIISAFSIKGEEK
jgi:hypothetical protein